MGYESRIFIAEKYSNKRVYRRMECRVMEINNYGKTTTYIFEIGTNGWGFYICYGKHGHGYFIAIPNWGVCVEAGEYDNTAYNAGRLRACLNETVAANAEEIADGIHKYMLWYKETNGLIKRGGNDDE